MSDVPMTGAEDPRWMPANVTPVGTRGHTGVPATITTSLTGTNNDLVITAKDCAYANDAPIKVQYAVLANGAPFWLYEDGTPAIIDRADLGFSILMRRAGMWGNGYSLTLINPGRASTLSIRRPAVKDIVVTLANSGAAVTTTPALLCAAINANPDLSPYMFAFPSSAVVAVLPAMPQRYFTGGMDVPGLVLLSLGSDTAGVVSTTGLGAKNALNGSRYVSAKDFSADTGAGLVTAMPAIALTGSAVIPGPLMTVGTANRGDVSEQYLARRDAWNHRRRAGDPLGKEHNRTLQLRSTRFGAARNYQRIPRQDRAVVASSFQNHTSDALAARTLG